MYIIIGLHSCISCICICVLTIINVKYKIILIIRWNVLYNNGSCGFYFIHKI